MNDNSESATMNANRVVWLTALGTITALALIVPTVIGLTIYLREQDNKVRTQQHKDAHKRFHDAAESIGGGK
jgi:hypothetical protein